jgi:hypothetical protein
MKALRLLSILTVFVAMSSAHAVCRDRRTGRLVQPACGGCFVQATLTPAPAPAPVNNGGGAGGAG